MLVPNPSGGSVCSQNRQSASILVLINFPARESLGKKLFCAVLRRRKTCRRTATGRPTRRPRWSVSGIANKQKDPQDQQTPEQGHNYEHQEVTPTPTARIMVVHHSEASNVSMRVVRTPSSGELTLPPSWCALSQRTHRVFRLESTGAAKAPHPAARPSFESTSAPFVTRDPAEESSRSTRRFREVTRW